MDRKLRFILVFVLLIFFAACEKKITEPDVYVPDNANHVFMFERDSYTNNYNFTVGYNNGNIKSTSVKLDWNSGAHPQDENYLATKIYRDGSLIKTFNTLTTHVYDDDGLTPDTYYRYTIANIVSTGMNVYDTLTVKTPSIAAPWVEISVPTNNVVKLFWRDMSELNGNFVVTRQGNTINPIVSQLNGIYSFVDNDVVDYSNYTYRIYKKGTYEDSDLTERTITVNSIHNTPVLYGATRVSAGVRLQWIDNSSAEDQTKIYRKMYGESDNAYAVISSFLMPNQIEYIDTSNLIEGQRYTYAISAVNRYLSPPVETNKSNALSVLISDSSAILIDFDDNSMSQFTSSGDATWTLEAGGSSKGYCAKSGYISNTYYGSSILEYQHNIPYGATVTVEFDYKVMSTDTSNQLYFYPNGNYPIAQWSTTPGWQSFNYTFVNYQFNGSFYWVFDKGYFATGGTNNGWIDNIQISYMNNDGKKVYVDMGGQK